MTLRARYGSGAVCVRGDSWYGRWYSNGRRVQRRLGAKRQPGGRDGLTRSQAEAELRRVMMMVSAVPLGEGELLTVGELADLYDADLRRRGRKPSTVSTVRSVVDTHLAPFFADRSVQSIAAEDVGDLVAVMDGKGLAAKSIRNNIGVLSGLCSFAQRRRLIRDNPTRHVELPENVVYSADIRYLTPVEVAALAAAAHPGPYEQIDRAMYVTAAMTGLRQGELIALRWRDVDWQAQRIRVRRNYVHGEWGTPKSRRSERSVPMADPVAAELDRLSIAAGDQDDDDLVFADPVRGGPLHRCAVLKRLRKALRGARLDTAFRFHDLRHTFGTQMAAAGVPMRTLQEWMGHRDIQTTQIYADYAPSAREAELIATAFGDLGPNFGPNPSRTCSTEEHGNAANTGVGDES